MSDDAGIRVMSRETEQGVQRKEALGSLRQKQAAKPRKPKLKKAENVKKESKTH